MSWVLSLGSWVLGAGAGGCMIMSIFLVAEYFKVGGLFYF